MVEMNENLKESVAVIDGSHRMAVWYKSRKSSLTVEIYSSFS